MFGDRGSRSLRSLNRHRSLIGPSRAFLSKIKCPIDRTQLRVFSQRVTPGVLLWILESGAIIEGSGKFWKNNEVPNVYPAVPRIVFSQAPCWRQRFPDRSERPRLPIKS